jgi:hypothetical protein
MNFIWNNELIYLVSEKDSFSEQVTKVEAVKKINNKSEEPMNKRKDWGCSSQLKCLSSMSKVLGLIPSTEEKKFKKQPGANQGQR